MSASAPSLPENSEGRPGGIWLLLSLLVHGAILAGLIFLIPVTEIAVHDEKAEAQAEKPVSASPEQIQEVAQQIQATQTDEVKASVEELLDTHKELAELQGQTQTQFATLAKKLAEDAPKKAEDALSQAVRAQKEAEQAQNETLTAMETVKAAQSVTSTTEEEKAVQQKQVEAALQQASEALSKAKDAQSAATTAQVVATQQMSFLSSSDEAKNAQAEAINAQAEANTKQDVAAETKQSMASASRQAERAAANAARAQQEADRAQQRVTDAQQNEAKTAEIARQQQEALDQMKPAPSDATAQREASKVRKNLETANKRLSNIQADLARNQKLLQDVSSRAAQARADAEKAKAEIQAWPEKVQAAQAAALSAQQAASAVQAKAQTAVAKAMASANAAPAAPPPAASPANSEPPPQLEGKNFAELYNTAVETEKKVATEYQAIRAAQVAVQKQIPLAEAQKYVQVAVPVRAALPPEATQADVTNAKALEAKKAAIEKARQELASMVSLTRGMAYQARATAGASDEGVTVSAEAMQAQAGLEQQLTAMATEAEGDRTADLSGLMKQAEKGGAKPGPQPEGGTTHGEAGGGASGTSPMPGKSASSTPGAPVFPEVGTPGSSIPGRKIHAGDYGVGSKWMFIDTWWVIGPFPNPERRNIETRFPPESVIDLGASYSLDDGSTVNWHFVQNSTPMVRPPLERSYAIYYAYTELWFDEEHDLWFATGSDDFSKIWINNLLVWASGMQHKSWRPNEGYRKVHFKQGLNRILLRVENGQAMCAFSFMLCLQKEPKP